MFTKGPFVGSKISRLLSNISTADFALGSGIIDNFSIFKSISLTCSSLVNAAGAVVGLVTGATTEGCAVKLFTPTEETGAAPP